MACAVRVAGEPGHHLRPLVGGVVVEDDVDDLAGRDRRLDGVEEADELLVPVALHAAAEHGPVEHVEGGEQRRRAVALVVMGHGRPVHAWRAGSRQARWRISPYEARAHATLPKVDWPARHPAG